MTNNRCRECGGGDQRHPSQGRIPALHLDVLMRGARGTELADEIRQVQPDARILFYTANSQALLLPDRLIPGLEADSAQARRRPKAARSGVLDAVRTHGGPDRLI